jgi:hypothetical protein
LGTKKREDAQIALTDKYAFLKEERFSARVGGKKRQGIVLPFL